MVVLLLYADDFMLLMLNNASVLQKQLDALASSCEQHQLTVQVNKTKVMVFETAKCCQKVFEAQWCIGGMRGQLQAPGGCLACHQRCALWHDSFDGCCKKGLVCYAATCALLGIWDPALHCKLFDTFLLVLPRFGYGSEV